MRKRAIQFAQEPALNYFELAGLITKLREIDPGSLTDLPHETGISRRRLYYLLEVGRFIKQHQISKTVAEKVGWTKLQIVAHHVIRTGGTTDDKLTVYLAMALGTKAHSLGEALRGRIVPATRAVTFHLNSDTKKELRDALIAYGAERGYRDLANKEEALMRLVRAAAADKP